MDIQKILVLRGPNVWANFPVIEVWVDLRPNLDVPSNTFPGFNERLKAWLPTMIEHRCGIGERGGFFQRLDTGTYLGHILEHSSLEIQSLVGPVVGFGRARESFVPGIYRVAIEYADERLGLACVRLAIEMLTAARTGAPFDIEAELAKLRKLSEDACFGPSTQSIVSAARKRGIPSIRLAKNSLVQLGYGSEQRRIWTAETDQTSAIAESIAQDKDLTRRLLMQAGVPVPQGRAVSSVDEAVHAADDLGYPVVVKPREGNHGRGVSIDLKDRAGVAAAFDIANAEGDGVIVEQCIAGDHHRLLVVGNRVVAAAQGEPDHVMGDGQRTIRQLVDWGNAQPNRGDPEIHPHDRLKLDPIALDLLKRQGLTVDSVPVIGRRVVLHYNGDLTTDVTSRVHPEVARVAVLAARTVGLNVAGIDLVLSDVGRPVEEQHGAVLEVNASPSLLMHVKPLRGEPQPVGEAIVDDLFPSAKNGRIPIVAVSGTSGKSSVIALLEGMLAGLPVPPRTGVACSDGLWVGERALQSAPSTDYESVSNLLVNPIVDLAIVEMEPLTVLEQGIAFDQCQVAVVTNLGSSDHLGLDLVDRDRMVLVERCGVDMVLPFGTAVLTADDPDVLAMIPKCPGKILLFSRDGDGSEVVTHRQRGGRTVAVCGTLLRFHEGASCLVEIPVPVELADYELENLLAALGAAWALGVSPAALATHVPGAFTRAPRGVEAARRVRTLELDGRTVAVGLPRNPLAARAAIEWVKRLSRDGKPFARRIALQTDLPRDWRDEDAFTMGSLYGQFFQEVRLREETQTPKENLAAKAIANGRPAAGLGAAFERGVRSANHAEFAFWHPGKVGDWRGVVRGLSPDDLLFVQVGNSQSFASFPLPEEGQTDSGSSSAATRSNSHEGSLAEV